MYYGKIRLYLVLLFLILGVVLHVQVGFEAAWYLYVAAAILLVTHFLFGTVWAAFRKLHKGDVDEAEILLNQIKRPEWLLKRHRAYYHFIRGMIALQRKELEEGKDNLEAALKIGLRTNNDRALTTLNLAHIHYLQEKHDAARAYLKEMNAFDYDDLMIKENAESLQKVLQSELN